MCSIASNRDASIGGNSAASTLLGSSIGGGGGAGGTAALNRGTLLTTGAQSQGPARTVPGPGSTTPAPKVRPY